MRKCGSWSIAHGISTGTLCPAKIVGKNAGADCMLVKKTIPMLVLVSNPKTARAAENVTRFATSSAIGYRVLTYSVLRNIRVFFGSKPSAIRSRQLSYEYPRVAYAL